jgi:hypothetical protein
MRFNFLAIIVSKRDFSPAPPTSHLQKNKPMVIGALANPLWPWVLLGSRNLYGSPRREKRVHLKFENSPENGMGRGIVRKSGVDWRAYV